MNGFAPLTISYSSTPSAQMSVRASVTPPRTCSGAIEYRRANRYAGRSQRGHRGGIDQERVLTPGQAEINEFQSAGRRDHRIGRLQVAVNDSVVMRIGQRVGGLMPYCTASANGRAHSASRSLRGRPSTYSIAMNARPFASPTS